MGNGCSTPLNPWVTTRCFDATAEYRKRRRQEWEKESSSMTNTLLGLLDWYIRCRNCRSALPACLKALQARFWPSVLEFVVFCTVCILLLYCLRVCTVVRCLRTLVPIGDVYVRFIGCSTSHSWNFRYYLFIPYESFNKWHWQIGSWTRFHCVRQMRDLVSFESTLRLWMRNIPTRALLPPIKSNRIVPSLTGVN
jgi:hypothetical protein